MKRIILLLFLIQISLLLHGQIIADHTVVDKFDDIPQSYINEVRKMWLVYPGESHSSAIRRGLLNLEIDNPVYAVSVVEEGTPESYTTAHLRASRATWGNYENESGWIYSYGEEDWFTNATAIARTKAGITYCNTHNLVIAAIGFGWCGDMLGGNYTAAADPVYGCRWAGHSVYGPDDNRAWGLDAEDYGITGNSVSMDSYLSATQQYIDYCKANGYATNVFLTTGPVDSESTWGGESGYQGHIKHEYIRDYAGADPGRILFDYADILCYNDNGEASTITWNGHTYPSIHSDNMEGGTTGHIGITGALRLAKAMWWMLARMAGWDGVTSTGIDELYKDKSLSPKIEITENELRISMDYSSQDVAVNLYNLHGGLMASDRAYNNTCILNISGLPTGIYLVTLQNSKNICTKKVFIR